MLQVKDLMVTYGGALAVNGINLKVQAGEIVALIGANGAGKTTTLNAITGIVRARQGSVHWHNVNLRKVAPHAVIHHRIAYCREGRHLFADMSVKENLLMGAYHLPNRIAKQNMEHVLTLFPSIQTHLRQSAGTLSGGQQQMVAVMRALMSDPALLLLDEPSLGLSPKAADEIFQVLPRLAATGTSVLLVEQNAVRALAVSQRAYVLEVGRMVAEGSSHSLAQDHRVQQAYLGYHAT